METESRLPIIKSFFDPRALAQLISEHYSLSSVHCQLIKATMRDVYQVMSHEGRFIALVYRANCAAESIREEVAFTDYLVSAGFSTVTALQTQNQEQLVSLIAPEGLRHMVLLPFVSGTISREPDLHTLMRYGHLVAELHQLSNDLPPPQARPFYDAEALIIQSLRTLKATTGYLQTVLDELEPIGSEVSRRLNAFPRDKSCFGIVHGDIIPSNMLIGLDGDLTLIDFDLFGLGWRMYDVAAYLNEIAYWKMAQGAEAAFLQGYTAVRQISNEERLMLPWMQIARHFSSLHTAAAHVNTWGSTIYLSENVINAAVNSIRELAKSSGSVALRSL